MEPIDIKACIMLRVAIILILLISLTKSVFSAPKNLLQLDTGGHMALIRDIAVTPDGKQLVSASNDKVIRVWDLVSGKTVRTIRGESAPGNPGKIYAMALSPDGKWLAVGGWMEEATKEPCCGDIRLYDFESGKLVKLLKGHHNSVASLSFSHDSSFLISGSTDKTAIIWDIKTRKQMHRFRGHTQGIFAVGFTPDGQRAVTGAYDYDLRLWNLSDGNLIKTMTGHKDKVNSIAVAANGAIASGDSRGEILIWDGLTGDMRKVLVNGSNSIGSLSYTSDSKYLIASEAGTKGPWAMHVYEADTGRIHSQYKAHDNIVLATAVTPDNSWVATGGGSNQEIHIWNLHTGKLQIKANNKPLVLRGVGQRIWSVGISPDGQQIGWGTQWTDDSHLSNGPLQYVLRISASEDKLNKPEALDSKSSRSFLRAVTKMKLQQNQWTLSHRKGGPIEDTAAVLDIKRNGKSIASITRTASDGFSHNAYSFTPDGNRIISAADDGQLTIYNRNGRKLGNFVGHEGDVWSVAISKDGRFLVSGSDDQTVRLWNINTHELLATLFHSNDKGWVMWTPEGFFMESDQGSKLVGWQINQGANKEARYVSANQLRKIFFRPDLVIAKILGKDARKFARAKRRFDVEKILSSGSAPEVEFVASGNNQESDYIDTEVKIKIKDTGGGVGEVLWKVNGKLRGKTSGKTGINAQELALGMPQNTIEVVAFNKAGFVESKSAQLNVRVKRNILKATPDLYVLAIGVNDYFDSRLKLHYAVKDATGITRVLKDLAKSRQGRKFYRHIYTKTLVNAEVSREKLTEAFQTLGQKMRPTDVFVFFIAGHGLTEQGEYYYLPAHFKYIGKNPIMKYGFGPKDWEKWTTNIKAEKSLLVFDTCESGSVAKYLSRGTEQLTAYARLKDRTGRVIVMATNQKDVALEGYKKKHGVLTYAMLEAIALGDNNQDKQIMLTELIGYVSERVPQMSCELTTKQGKPCYRQVPQANLTGAVFPIVPQYENAHPERISGTLQIGDAYPGQPTHVTIKAAKLADANGKALRVLPPFYKLKPVNEKGENTLVARDGKIIGYIPTETIQPTQ